PLVFVPLRGMNGPPYFPWKWQRLNPALGSALALVAAVPLFLAQALFSRQPRRVHVAILLTALSTFSLELVGVATAAWPSGLRRISDIVESPQATSYYTIALDLFQ